MRLLIYGSKEFANTVSNLIKHCGHELIGMVDDFNTGSNILGSLDSIRKRYPPESYGFALAIGYNDLHARWNLWKKVRNFGYQTPSLIHPSAYIADNVKIGAGVMIMARTIVDIGASVGDLSVIWPGACINHDSSIGVNTFISPGAIICGSADIGSHCFIGAGSVIVDHGKVPTGSYLKMMTRYTGRNS